MEYLIQTLEILREAVYSRDKDMAFEAVTIFLMQFISTFGHAPNLVNRTFPVLEELKDHILSCEFEDAQVIVLALLARFRAANDRMKESGEQTNRIIPIEAKIQ